MPRPTRAVLRCARQFGASCAALLTAIGLSAQSPRQGFTPAAQPLPTFSLIEQAQRSQDYTVTQLRRFRGENGTVVTVRETLEIDADGSLAPLFRLTFQNVEGEPPGSPLQTQWQQAYGRYGELFVRQGGFQIRDLAKTLANYTLHDFGPVQRAGRLARRMVVFPNTFDKAVWVVDVDALTYVPLFFAEFDSQLRLFAEVEAISFSPTVAPLTGKSTGVVTATSGFAAAVTLMGNPSGVIDQNVGIAWDYSLDKVEVRDDPLNGKKSLTMTYTDGIDQFVITQNPASSDPFAGMPSTSGGAHTIARFRDPALSALVFWEDGVSFHVAGRGALTRLDGVARALYLQALSTN